MTDFQFKYLYNLIKTNRAGFLDVNHQPLNEEKIEGIVFAVTSSNHSGTKRNPIPFYLRAIMLEDFARELDVPTYIYGIDDIGYIKDFASYTVKRINHESEGDLILTPKNTWVLCSSMVLKMYQQKGYTILPAELENLETKKYQTKLPWDYVELIASSKSWPLNREVIDNIHYSSFKIWSRYGLGHKTQEILNDPIIGDDGDITETRNYNSYVRQMDEIAELKFRDTSTFIQPGRIGDIGCAVGSWIKLASEENELRESDFYGIELARQLFDICIQRKHNGEFKNPNVFFSQKNAVTGLCFHENSMNTIHTSSLTHEIESYGSRESLLQFIKNRYKELKTGGVWINRDVIGPENGDELIWMKLSKNDGRNDEKSNELDKLSTYERFFQFVKDFRKTENDQITFKTIQYENEDYIEIRYRDAAEYILTKDYTDNWESEMHERFCYWSIEDWKSTLKRNGFRFLTGTKAYTNSWIVENRMINQVVLMKKNDIKSKIPYPPTNAIIVALKEE